MQFQILKNPGIDFYSGFRKKLYTFIVASDKKNTRGVQFEILKNPGMDFYSGFRKTSQGGGGGANLIPKKVGPRNLKSWIRHCSVYRKEKISLN